MQGSAPRSAPPLRISPEQSPRLALNGRINTPYFLKEKAGKPHGSMAYPQGISSLPHKLGDETI